MNQDLDIQPDPEDLITPRELAELIKEVPDPLVDAPTLMLDSDPGKAAKEYIDKIKNRPGGAVIKLSRLSRNAGDTQSCGDCSKNLSGGDIFLVGAQDPNDIDFGNEAAISMGFLTPTIKPEGQQRGQVTMVRMTPMSIHQLGEHNNYDASQYRNGVKIDPKQVLGILRPSVVKSSAPNFPRTGPTSAGK